MNLSENNSLKNKPNINPQNPKIVSETAGAIIEENNTQVWQYRVVDSIPSTSQLQERKCFVGSPLVIKFARVVKDKPACTVVHPSQAITQPTGMSHNRDEVEKDGSKSSTATTVSLPLTIHFTKEQKHYLEAKYKDNPRPKEDCFEAIAEFLDVDVDRVRNFFRNKRYRDRTSGGGIPSVADTVSLDDVKNAPMRFTEEQKCELEAMFKINPFPDYDECVILAERLGIKDTRRVVDFYRNKRNEIKKIAKKTGAPILKRAGVAKRRRSYKYTEEQQSFLLKRFLSHPDTPNAMELEYTSNLLGVPIIIIRDFFRNERRKITLCKKKRSGTPSAATHD